MNARQSGTGPITLILFSVIVAVLLLFALCCKADQSVTLAWDPNTDPEVTGAIMYYGNASRNYPYHTNLGNVTRATVNGLQAGLTYYFAVTATNSAGLESDYSNEVSASIPSDLTNSFPTISTMIPVDVGQGRKETVPFIVWDAETPPGNLTVTASSSNPLIVPTSRLLISGTNHNRSITIGPCVGLGETLITILASDGDKSSMSSFLLTVYPVPVAPIVWMRTKYEVSPSPDGPWTNMAVTVFPFVFDPKLFYKSW
jgi:hypothetical protein